MVNTKIISWEKVARWVHVVNERAEEVGLGGDEAGAEVARE
jgi:hypothetical protein